MNKDELLKQESEEYAKETSSLAVKKFNPLEPKLLAIGYYDGAESREKCIEGLEKQIEKIKNQKVFLLQRVDSYDNSIDKQFYTTDEELAKEWNNYCRRNYYYGQAIELEEFSDKERIKEELESD